MEILDFVFENLDVVQVNNRHVTINILNPERSLTYTSPNGSGVIIEIDYLSLRIKDITRFKSNDLVYIEYENGKKIYMPWSNEDWISNLFSDTKIKDGKLIIKVIPI